MKEDLHVWFYAHISTGLVIASVSAIFHIPDQAMMFAEIILLATNGAVLILIYVLSWKYQCWSLKLYSVQEYVFRR